MVKPASWADIFISGTFGFLFVSCLAMIFGTDTSTNVSLNALVEEAPPPHIIARFAFLFVQVTIFGLLFYCLGQAGFAWLSRRPLRDESFHSPLALLGVISCTYVIFALTISLFIQLAIYAGITGTILCPSPERCPHVNTGDLAAFIVTVVVALTTFTYAGLVYRPLRH